MKLKRHKTLREQIVFSLRESIIRGDLSPGEKLTEPELSERLGISRTPIREAFRQLESEGFLTVMPRRGAVVARITREDVLDFYELESVLEGYAARKAAERITPRDVEKLQEINDAMSGLADRNLAEPFYQKHEEFHRVFLKLAGNERLLEMREGIAQRFRGFRQAALTFPDRMAEAVRQHRRILKALEKGDGPMAEALVVEQALTDGEALSDRIEGYAARARGSAASG